MQETPIEVPAVDATGLQRQSLCESLIVIPCSSSKRKDGGSPEGGGDSILDSLPSRLAAELRSRRARNTPIAQLDESVLLPAVERYTGGLYQSAGAAMDTLVQSSAGILIVSGGYGVVGAAEPIGWYSQLFKPGNVARRSDRAMRRGVCYSRRCQDRRRPVFGVERVCQSVPKDPLA